MIPLRKVLQSIEKSLEDLTQKTKDMHKLLDTLEGALTPEKPRARKAAKKKRARKAPAKRKPKKITGTAAVLTIIQKSRKGVDTATLKKETGLKDTNIRIIIYRLKKQGRIKTEKKGIYVKA